MPLRDYLVLMLLCFLLTVVIESAVLLLALSRRHTVRTRLFAGLWLTAITYPIVWLVLPRMFTDRGWYLLVAEIFAPVAECLVFGLAFVKPLHWDRRATLRDMVAITVANLCSFGAGELIRSLM